MTFEADQSISNQLDNRSLQQRADQPTNKYKIKAAQKQKLSVL